MSPSKMLSFVCCSRTKEDSDIALSTGNGEQLFLKNCQGSAGRSTSNNVTIGSSSEDQSPDITRTVETVPPAKPALKKTLSDSPSILSVSSFRSVKSTFSVAASDDFYSVCSEDSFKSTAPNAKQL